VTQATEPARHFAGCPECGQDDGYLNAGRSHWMFCDEHQVKWCIGSNLFSSWREETEAEQRERWKCIEGYRDAVVYPPEMPKFIKTEIALCDDGKTQSLNVIKVGPLDVTLPQGTDLRQASWLLRQLADEMAEQCRRSSENLLGFGCEAEIEADRLRESEGARA
jgi:hypothetical protein